VGEINTPYLAEKRRNVSRFSPICGMFPAGGFVFTILSYCDQKLQWIQMDASRGVPSAFSVEHKAQLDAELMKCLMTLHMGTVPYVCWKCNE